MTYTITDKVKAWKEKQTKTKRNARIIQLYKDGMSMIQIAKNYKMSRQRVWRIIKKYEKTQQTLS